MTNSGNVYSDVPRDEHSDEYLAGWVDDNFHGIGRLVLVRGRWLVRRIIPPTQWIYAAECAPTNEQDVGGIDLQELLLRVLATALRWH
jgi:hypothetical protein